VEGTTLSQNSRRTKQKEIEVKKAGSIDQKKINRRQSAIVRKCPWNLSAYSFPFYFPLINTFVS
jgi:hypothetical protein